MAGSKDSGCDYIIYVSKHNQINLEVNQSCDFLVVPLIERDHLLNFNMDDPVSPQFVSPFPFYASF